MSNICETELLTSVNSATLMDIYSDGINPSLLGSVTIQKADRDSETGLLLNDRLNQVVSNLQEKGVIPKAPAMTGAKNQATVIQKFMDSEAEFIEGVKKEYCYYNSRYRYSLNDMIKTLSDGYAQDNKDLVTIKPNKDLVTIKLEKTLALNQKLNDITQIMNAATRLRLAQSQEHNQSINALNETLMARSKKLNEESQILTSKQDDAVLYKNMVKVTTEKANYTNNMLMIYSFLNIIAISTLFYVYRSIE
jgi:hypothetical protein